MRSLHPPSVARQPCTVGAQPFAVRHHRHRTLLLAILGCLCSAIPLSGSEEPLATVVHLDPAHLPGLQAGATQAGVRLAAAPDALSAFGGRILCWEARSDGEITAAIAQRIGQFVQAGGGLLISLDAKPGTGLMHLGFALPTTAWNVAFPTSVAGGPGCRVAVASADRDFFPLDLVGLSMPFCAGIRPVSAVERGQGRYEIFARTIPKIDIAVPAGNTFWTRPLLNRDWRIRLSADDLSATPLVLTGRYGAGRVAVLASSCAGIDADARAAGMWHAVFSWLVAGAPAASTPPAGVRIGAIHRDEQAHALAVTLENPGQAAQTVQLVARICTWERAFVGDELREAVVPPGGSLSISVPLPHPGTTGYQALAARDAYVVRLGILSGDGATLLAERSVPVDLRPRIGIQVSTDDVAGIPYPFHAPGPGTMQFSHRMGTPLQAYAYKPGQPGTITVTIGNDAGDLTPLALIADETAPDNPSLLALGHEGAFAEKSPIDGVQATGCWIGKPEHENLLSFTFPTPMMIAGVTLIGDAIDVRLFPAHNPGRAAIELDGRQVATLDDLDRRFIAEHGRVRLSWAAAPATTLRVRLPWVPLVADAAKSHRREPWLAGIEISGMAGDRPAAPAAGTLTVTLQDVLSGELVSLPPMEASVPPGGQGSFTVAFTAPAQGAGVRFLRISASFAAASAATVAMVIDPPHPLAGLEQLVPNEAPNLGFIVTRGFRNLFGIGTGTREIREGWGQPDDLVWAYSRQLKQIGRNARTEATRLYVTESDLRHYSTPWRDFPNGEPVYDLGIPGMVERMSRQASWASSPIAILNHSDRWDSGPQMSGLHGWQDFVEFDQHLRALGKPGLQGKTREQLASEIHAQHEADWQAWQLDAYLHSLRAMREAFAKQGKKLVLRSQGIPLVPSAYEAELSATIRGMSDDETWGMQDGNLALSTGRQMAVMAFNPSFALSTLLQWGYDSPMCNPIWHSPVGTTEPSRRHYYDRAWRAKIDRNGVYQSMHSYGYNLNAGFSYTMTANDWQEYWRVEERHSLLAPEAPLGVGLVLSSARRDDPAHVAFSGGGEVTETLSELPLLENLYRRLQDLGLSIPFSANAGSLSRWTGTSPLILLNLCDFSEAELMAVQAALARGVHVVAFQGDAELSAHAAALFGVHADGSRASALALGDCNGHAITASEHAVLVAGSAANLTPQQAQGLLGVVAPILDPPLRFPSGIGGYGFTMGTQEFVVVEEWTEVGRQVAIQLRARPGARSAHACDVNDHRALEVVRTGDSWTITVPLRPADAALVCLEEGP